MVLNKKLEKAFNLLRDIYDKCEKGEPFSYKSIISKHVGYYDTKYKKAIQDGGLIRERNGTHGHKKLYIWLPEVHPNVKTAEALLNRIDIIRKKASANKDKKTSGHNHVEKALKQNSTSTSVPEVLNTPKSGKVKPQEKELSSAIPGNEDSGYKISFTINKEFVKALLHIASLGLGILIGLLIK